MWPSGKLFGQVTNNEIRSRAAFASGMPESARAAIVLPVQDHVVVVIRTGSHRDRIKLEIVANLPSNDVIRTRRISAQAKSSDDFASAAVQRKTASEDDDSSDHLADHRVIRRAKAGRVAEYGLGIGGGASGLAVQALPGLRRGEVVCR